MFTLPIQYNQSQEVEPTIIKELEFVTTEDPSGTPIYDKIFSPTNKFSKKNIADLAKYYTTKTQFLKESTLLYKQLSQPIESYDTFIEEWDKLRKNEEFKLTYQYVNYDKFDFLNESSKFMFMISLYFITSPVLFLFSPIIMLLLPFVLINMKGGSVCWDTYKSNLYEVTKHHAMINLITNFNRVNPKERMMLIAGASIFLVQTYCNGYAVYKFYQNIQSIHTSLETVQTYMKNTINNMNHFQSVSEKLSTYNNFNTDVTTHKTILINYLSKLDYLKKISFSWHEIFHLGYLRTHFYELFSNKELQNTIEYSLQFNGYISNIEQLSFCIQKKKVNTCSFSKHTSFSNAYYPTDKPIKNSYKLNKNMIITGPNASGKTTFIKMSFINTLLSQQFGCGFYKKAKICPYDTFCSYINIPDTSGRDSLFQAEARRCKEVLNCIDSTQNRVLCIFDELFSGTNPKEASASAYAFLKYISSRSNCTFLLTTHFLDVCQKLNKTKSISIHNMKTICEQNKLTYTYKLTDGISDICGGINVLIDMNYPNDIINSAKLCG